MILDVILLKVTNQNRQFLLLVEHCSVYYKRFICAHHYFKSMCSRNL